MKLKKNKIIKRLLLLQQPFYILNLERMSNIKNLEVIKNFIEISSTILTLWISILVYRLQKKENNPRLVIEHKLVDENIIRIEDEFFLKIDLDLNMIKEVMVFLIGDTMMIYIWKMKI